MFLINNACILKYNAYILIYNACILKTKFTNKRLVSFTSLTFLNFIKCFFDNVKVIQSCCCCCFIQLIARQLQEHEKDKFLLAKKKEKERMRLKESERLAKRLQHEERLKAERHRGKF